MDDNIKNIERFFGKALQFTFCERVAETCKMKQTKTPLSWTGMIPVWDMKGTNQGAQQTYNKWCSKIKE